MEIAQCGKGPILINSIESLAQHAFLSDYKHLKGLYSRAAGGQTGEQKQGCYEGIYHYTTSQGQIQGCLDKYVCNTTFKDNLQSFNLLWAQVQRKQWDVLTAKVTHVYTQTQKHNLAAQTTGEKPDTKHKQSQRDGQ